MSLTVGIPLASDDPGKEIRAGLAVLGVFGGLFVAWAAAAPLDAATTATGQISVSQHDELVQHPEGGSVAAVDVVEGQAVRAGQILVQLAPEAKAADVKSLDAQVLALEAQQAKLTAEMNGSLQITWPEALVKASGDDSAAAREAMRDQQGQFNASLALMRAEQSIDQRRAAGLQDEIGGLQAQVQSNEQEQALLQQQLTGVSSLAARGFASQTSVRALERTEAELAGVHGQYGGTINDDRQQIAQYQLDSERLVNERRAAAASALRDAQDQLNALLPKLHAAQVDLDRSTLRAQTDGVVTGLSVFHAGTVVAPGQKLMEIVPSHPTLIIEARISAADIQGVHAGQRCEIRVSALQGRPAPIIGGSVIGVSADSFSDDRTGQSFYTAKILVPQGELNRIDQSLSSALRPGVPVQVVIPMRKRTAFEYLFEPLSQSLWQAFRQR